MKNKANVVICPPCGESVAQATKEGQNKGNTLWPLLPRLVAVLPPQGREMSHGFTLIELLVVVLIIGILAAVAVPQYQQAVIKSRFVQVESDMRNLFHAVQMCSLSKGSVCRSLDELDIEIPSCKEIPGLFGECKYLIDGDDGRVAMYEERNMGTLCNINPRSLEQDGAVIPAGTLYCHGTRFSKVGFTKYVQRGAYIRP